jgi:hypothetical protein
MTDELMIISRVSSRFLEAYTFPRDFHLPKELRNKPPMVPEGTDLAIWTWEVSGVPYGIAFAGKANKPLWNYRFRDESQRQHRIDETIRGRKSVIEEKQKRLQKQRDYQHPYKVGDIFNTSWGYDQTNVDFYEVVEVRGKMLFLREVGKVVAREEHGADYVVPSKGHYVGGTIKVLPRSTGGIKIEGHYGSLWDGKPEYQTGFGFGH